MSLLSEQFERIRKKTRKAPSQVEFSIYFADGLYNARVAAGGRVGVGGVGKTPEDALKNAVAIFIGFNKE